jgi:GMP synthase (glutamine-hydrolysing)
VLQLGVPTLGICYGFQVMAQQLGGEVANTGCASTARRMPRHRRRRRAPRRSARRAERLDEPRRPGRGAPEGFEVLASTAATPVAAFGNAEKCFYGVQWHPEVKHSDYGQDVIVNFLHKAAGLPADWNSGNVIAEQVERIRAQVGTGRVLGAVRRRRLGRLDGARAQGRRRPARRRVRRPRPAAQGRARAGRERLRGLHRRAPHHGRRARDVPRRAGRCQRPRAEAQDHRPRVHPRLREGAADLVAEAAAEGEPIRFLVQGTLYPDVVESGGGTGTANIKSHHNVGGLPEDLQFELVEPLRTLFKDEVRADRPRAGPPRGDRRRQPFPGPGLGIRIVGEVTADRLEILRDADAIAREELTKAGLDGEIWQCPVVLLADVRSVGVQGDGRTYGHPIVLRPVSSRTR